MDIIFRNIVSQLLIYVGVVFVAGFIIGKLCALFYRLVGGGRAAVYLTGAIGTPIHELSHALMCLVFGHRITDMSLFSIDDESGTLGYVNHSYNPRNPYQLLGNYFIGVAPIILGGAAMLLMMKWLLPAAFVECSQYIDAFCMFASDGISADWFGYCFIVIRATFLIILSQFGANPGFWIFFIFALCVSLHMTLSGADIKGSLGALPILVVILAAANFGLGLASKTAYQTFLTVINSIGAYLVGMLLFALMMCLVSVVVALIIRTVLGIFGRR